MSEPTIAGEHAPRSAGPDAAGVREIISFRPTHRHVKTGGLYQTLDIVTNGTNGDTNGQRMVLYTNGMRSFVREHSEFFDGRFQRLSEAERNSYQLNSSAPAVRAGREEVARIGVFPDNWPTVLRARAKWGRGTAYTQAQDTEGTCHLLDQTADYLEAAMSSAATEDTASEDELVLLLTSSAKADESYTRMLLDRSYQPRRAHLEGARNAIRTAVEAGRKALALTAAPAPQPAAEVDRSQAPLGQRLIIGSKITLAQCPIGLFLSGEELCLKTEYSNNEGRIDAYIVSSGEFFCGSHPQTIANQRSQVVQPVALVPPPDRTRTEGDTLGQRFARGQRVEKISGGCWRGRVVGTYSTSLTPVGYAVESENEPGSVQIYPEAALRSFPPETATPEQSGEATHHG